jgi:hypothetical protein
VIFLAMSFRKMIRLVVAFLFFATSTIAFLQNIEPQVSDANTTQSADDGGGLSAPEIKEIPIIHVKNMVRRPSLVPVFKAVASSNIPEAHAEILVEYNMQGDITDVKFLKTAGNGSVNKAILEWAKSVKLVPGEAGKGRLLFDIKVR